LKRPGKGRCKDGTTQKCLVHIGGEVSELKDQVFLLELGGSQRSPKEVGQSEAAPAKATKKQGPAAGSGGGPLMSAGWWGKSTLPGWKPTQQA